MGLHSDVPAHVISTFWFCASPLPYRMDYPRHVLQSLIASASQGVAAAYCTGATGVSNVDLYPISAGQPHVQQVATC